MLGRSSDESGTKTSHSTLLNELSQGLSALTGKVRMPRKGNWFTQAVAANKEMASEFFDAKEELKDECFGGTILEFDDDDDARAEGRADDERDDPDSSFAFISTNDLKRLGCDFIPPKCQMDFPDRSDCHMNFPDQPNCPMDFPNPSDWHMNLPDRSNCHMEFPYKTNCQMNFPYKIPHCQASCALPDQSGTPILERQGDGIDFIFELVESAMCGDQSVGKRPNGGKGITFEDLTAYNMPALQKDSLVDDETASQSGRSTHTHRTSSTRSRSTTRSNRGKNSRSRRKSIRDSPSDRSQSPTDREAFKKRERNAAVIAKKATAYIRENVLEQARIDAEREMMEYRRKKSLGLKSALKKSSLLTPDKCSAFHELPPSKVTTASTAELTATSSRDSRTISTPTTGLKEVSILNVGSGSSVSSFGDGRHSWSQHSNRSLIDGMSKSSKAVVTPPTVPEVDESTEEFYMVMRTVFNFAHSFSTNVRGKRGSVAPVNKAVCLLSLVFLLLFWPEDREKDRIKIEKKEIPKKAPSLLTLVTKG